MTKKQESLLAEYAAKVDELANLEAEIESSREKILGILMEAGTDTLQEDYGTFSVVSRTRWEYSDKYADRKNQYDTILKEMRKVEELDGEAKAEKTKGLSYRKYVPQVK